MHPSGVKRIASWFRIRPPSEEKAPFANSTFTNNGSIVKDSKMTGLEDGKKGYGSRDLSDSSLISDEKGFEEKPKMSLLRKFCFFLSLNGWVAYVAVLLWAIPCRHPLCIPPQKDWDMDVNLLLTTNMETTKYSGLPYSVIFGFSDDSGAYLASLAISDGKMMWNHSTEHILRRVFCQFDNALTFNQYPGCIMTADNFIGAFDASNGNIVWRQNLSVPESDIIHNVAIAKGHNTPYVLGVSNDYLFAVSANNGTALPAVALPCSWSPIDVKLVGPFKLRKRKLWTLVCQFGDSVEVWTLEEGELLSPPEKSSGKRLRDDVNFSLLFRQDSYIGSIDLAGDVTRTLDSLALSWADSVAMVTAQAPFHHLRKTWERRFSGPLGDSLPVTSLVSGHFTDPKKIEIAVAVQDGPNTTIHILRKNGTFVTSTNLGRGSVMSMERIPGLQHETDALVIESVHGKHLINSSQEQSEQTTRSYFTMQYVGKEMKYQMLISAEVYESTLSEFSEGIVDLLTASKNSNGSTKLSRIMITRSSVGSICESEVRKNTSTMLVLN